MRRVVLFARRPRLGAVKTRLVPPLTREQALALYEAFVADQLAFLRAMAPAGYALELCTDEPWEARDGDGSVAVTLQGDGDLGDRLLRAARRASAEGASAVVFLGADAPTLPAARIHEAFVRLANGADAVVAAAEDGGYVLLGVRRVPQPLFDGIPWGTAEVMERTRAAARRAGIRVDELLPWYDVDDAAGLARLRRGVAAGEAHDRAPATARALAAIAETVGAPGSRRGEGRPSS